MLTYPMSMFSPIQFGPIPFLIYYPLMHLSEPLESRLLLSTTLKSGILRVLGGAGSDSISISLRNHSYNVVVNATTSTFSAASVHGLVIRGNAGNDSIRLVGPI